MPSTEVVLEVWTLDRRSCCAFQQLTWYVRLSLGNHGNEPVLDTRDVGLLLKGVGRCDGLGGGGDDPIHWDGGEEDIPSDDLVDANTCGRPTGQAGPGPIVPIVTRVADIALRNSSKSLWAQVEARGTEVAPLHFQVPGPAGSGVSCRWELDGEAFRLAACDPACQGSQDGEPGDLRRVHGTGRVQDGTVVRSSTGRSRRWSWIPATGRRSQASAA